MAVSKSSASVGANLVFSRQARQHLNLRIFARGSSFKEKKENMENTGQAKKFFITV
jgi:hypothetical protein